MQVNLNQTMIVEPIPPDPQAAFAPTPPPPPAASKYNLFVLVDLPPAGFTTVSLALHTLALLATAAHVAFCQATQIFLTGNATAATPGVAAQGKVSNVKPSNAGSITNGVMTLSFDAKSGNLATVQRRVYGASTACRHAA